MKKLLTFEEIRRYLIDDAYVRDEIVWTYKHDALAVLQSLARGEEPDLPDADVDTFLLDLLHNVGRLYKRYTAHGSYGTRVYDDVEHKVTVRGMRDFEYRDQRFTSLTAVAKVITGSPWSGPMFFGLKTKKREAA